jgi:hypothetical protein
MPYNVGMSRFNFGSLDSEPNGLANMYQVLSDAQSYEGAYSYMVPAGLQTREYAEAVLGIANGPDVAQARADTRERREQILRDAGVDATHYIGAAALQHTLIAGTDVMVAQLGRLRRFVEDDIEAGPGGRLHVGIVPVSVIKPMPDDFPPGVPRLSARDIQQVRTPDGTYVMGNDQFEVDRIGDPGIRGREALYRQGVLGRWASTALFGEAALAQIDEAEAVLVQANQS